MGALVFLSWLVRICVALLLLRLVLRFAAGVLRGLRGEPGPDRSRPKGAVDLVRDPVCGTYLSREGPCGAGWRAGRPSSARPPAATGPGARAAPPGASGVRCPAEIRPLEAAWAKRWE